MNRDPLVFINHILESIENIEEFVKNVDKKNFYQNKEKQSAVVRQIEIIGEAVKNLPVKFKKRYSHIEWKEIAGMRDKLIHHYFGVDLEKIWEVIE